MRPVLRSYVGGRWSRAGCERNLFFYCSTEPAGVCGNMGAKNPDRLVDPPSPLRAMTLAEMHVARWELRATCDKCKVHLKVSLPAMIKTHGPDAIWWGQNPKCPGYECATGRLTYHARAIPSGSWVSMRQAPSEGSLELWRTSYRIRDRGPR